MKLNDVHSKSCTSIFKSMHIAVELAEFYISYNGGIFQWYNPLIGWVLCSLLLYWTIKTYTTFSKFKWKMDAFKE